MLQTTYFDIKEHRVAACHVREYADSTTSKHDKLYLHVKQYTPRQDVGKDSKGAITIVAAHGVGLPKELYEPLWDELYQHSTEHGYAIRGIWIADAVNQGMSGVINEDKLSNDYSWMDHPRDLLLMINQFSDEMPRPLVGIGHSFGGCQITNLAYLHPRLLTSLILLDPVIQLSPPALGLGNSPPGGVNFTVHRQDVWPNRAAAAAAQRKLSKGWDPRVLERMVQYGFRPLPTATYPDLPPDADPVDPPVTLTTTKHQDTIGQIRANFEARQPDGRIRIDRETHADMDPLAAFVPLYRPEPRSTFQRLPSLLPSALWIVGDKTFLNLDEMREGIRSTGTGVGGSGGPADGRVEEVVLHGKTHLFPFMAVKETSKVCATWLGSEMRRFQDQQDRWEARRALMTRRDHLTLSKTWLDTVKPLSAFKGRL